MFTYKPNYEASHALVVGIDEYEHMPSLTTSVRGTNALEALLRTSFQFNVTKLVDRNATRERILDWFGSLNTGPDDRVLFYFSGHGLTRSTSRSKRIGYLALSETNNSFTSALEMSKIIQEAEDLTAKHVLIVIDACFSGLAFTKSAPITLPENPHKFMHHLISRGVRYVITAGGDDEVVDEDLGPGGQYSLFTHFLLEGLRGDASTIDGILRGRELGNYLEKKVGSHGSTARHKPRHGELAGVAGSDGGDFVFSFPTEKHRIEGCTIKDPQGLLNAHPHHSNLLKNLMRSETLTVLESITVGESGSGIYLVAVTSQNDGPNGRHYCKIYRTPTGEEREVHERARQTKIGKYIPALTDATPVIEGWMASLYSVAHNTTRTKALSHLLLSDFNAASKNLALLVNMLREWNAPSPALDYKDPHSLLLSPFHPFDPIERVVEPLETFIPGLMRHMTHIQFMDEVLPNPIAYVFDQMLWATQPSLTYLLGHTHGDLHSNNVICSTYNRAGSEGEYPVIIDFDTYDNNSSIFFDLAYLEIDIGLRVLNPNQFSLDDWLDVSLQLVSSIDLGETQGLGMQATILNNLIRPIRTAVKEMTEQTRSNLLDMEAAFWIARTSAGLAFARKRKVNTAQRKLALLLSAQSLKKTLDVLEIRARPQKPPFWVEWQG